MSPTVNSKAVSRGGPGGPYGPARTLNPIPTTWRSYVAELPAWLIVAGALAVSFWTQVQTVNAHGFARWEALVWGASTDAGVVAFLFLAREGAHRGTPTWGAWLGSIGCSFMSVQYNTVSAVQTGDWLAVEAHLWMPALALGTWYWMLHGRHRRWNLTLTRRIRRLGPPMAADDGTPIEAPTKPPGLVTLPSDRTARTSGGDGSGRRNGRPPRYPDDEMEQIIAGMERDGVPLLGVTLAKTTGLSPRQAQRYMRERRHLQVVG